MSLMAFESVQDGDTFTCRCKCEARTLLRVRLPDIQAPERGEPFWGESKMALWELMHGKDVLIEMADSRRGGLAAWNRQVAHAWVDGVYVPWWMVRRGWAWIWTPYGSHGHIECLRGAEAQARMDRLGIWGLDNFQAFHERSRPSVAF